MEVRRETLRKADAGRGSDPGESVLVVDGRDEGAKDDHSEQKSKATQGLGTPPPVTQQAGGHAKGTPDTAVSVVAVRVGLVLRVADAGTRQISR